MIPTLKSLFGPLRRGCRPLSVLALIAAAPAVMVSCGSSKQTQGDGVTYRHDRVSSQPWSIHIVKIDRARADLILQTTLARDTVRGLSTLADQVRSLPPSAGRPVAALNGDFYVVDERSPYVGDPRGLQILRGELVSAPTDQASFWIDTSGQPQATNVTSKLQVTWPDGSATPIGLNEDRTNGHAVLFTPRFGDATGTRGGRELVLERAGNGPWLPLQAGREYTARVREARDRANAPLNLDIMVLSLSPALLTNTAIAQVAAGATVKISTATVPDLAGVQMAISGGYVLVRDGQTVTLNVPKTRDYKYASVGQRHPRSAIGASRDHIYLLEVDGRQPELSMGMTLAEMADYMKKIGCELALNLDGGASATFWFNGRVMNSPCNQFERPIANGIVVLRKDAAAPSPERKAAGL